MFNAFRGGFNQQGGMGGFESIFEDLFGGGFAQQGMGKRPNQPEKIVLKADLSF